MRVVLYARVSSEQQAEKDLSIPAQIEALKKYACEQKYDIAGQYVDAGKSAKTANRPQFQEMIERSKEKPAPFDGILVWKLSRFARNREDSLIYKNQLRKRGISVISINEKIDDSAAGKMLEGIIETMDEFFSANLATDTIRGMKANAAKGCRNGGTIAMGYKAEHFLDGKNKKTRIVPDPIYAPLIKKIFAMYLSGKGMKAIAMELNEQGIKTNKGKAWSNGQISYALKNETYIGNVAWNKLSNQRIWRGQAHKDEQLRFEGIHEAIIDKKTFTQVQEILSNRGTSKKCHPRAVASPYLLSGLVHCSICGASYQAAGAKSGRHHYYTCRNKIKKGKSVCSSKMIPVKLLESTVLQCMKDVVLVDKAFTELIKLTNRELAKLHSHNGHSVQLYDSQIADGNQKLDKLYHALETGKLEIEDLAPRIRQLKVDITDLEQKRHSAIRLTESRKVLELTNDQIRECVLNLRTVLESSPIATQKAFLQSFIKQVTIEGDKARIEYTFPLQELVPDEQRDLVLAIGENGVADGTRTRNNWNHNPVLYQLNYSHHSTRRQSGSLMASHLTARRMP